MDNYIINGVEVRLCPFKHLAHLSNILTRTQRIFYSEKPEDFEELLSGNQLFKSLIKEALSLNGVEVYPSTDNIFTFCIGYEEAPLLAVMNGLSYHHVPVENGGEEDDKKEGKDDDSELDFNSPFPFIDATGTIQFFRYPSLNLTDDFYQLKSKLSEEISSLSSPDSPLTYPTGESLLIHNSTVQKYCFELCRICGLTPEDICVKHLVQLCLYDQGNTDVLTRMMMAGQRDLGESRGNVSPVKSFKWYFVGELTRLGVALGDALELCQYATIPDTRDILYGMSDPTKRAKLASKNTHQLSKKERKALYSKLYSRNKS